jgi:triacylglycerol esterase/lipase EstA (alpha/beta hydrolase family)
LEPDLTLTVFVHGYRGNEFDLSKFKSYLTILLGFSHFYAVRNLNMEDIADSHLARLGETAAKEINDFLSKNTKIRHVNVVGFSMGGVIARAMLPHLRAHSDKFHMLLTLASPHMGMK